MIQGQYKEILVVLLWALVLWAGVSYGAEIPYTYKFINQTGLQDINLHGDLVAIEFDQGALGVVMARKSKMSPVEFRCNNPFDDTAPRRLNNRGDAAGSCLTAQHNKEVGFIRQKSGILNFIDVPGADGTILHTISEQDEVCGQYYNPLDPNASGYIRFHGFCQSKLDRVRPIDVPIPHSVTVITGVSRSGKKSGNYFTYDPITNETSQWHAFEYDNGVFTSIERPGAVWSYTSDRNNLDQVLYEDDLDAYLLDDGIYFKISDPPVDPGFTLGQVDNEGFNDAGEIVGMVTQVKQGQLVTKSFIATPTPMVADKKQ